MSECDENWSENFYPSGRPRKAIPGGGSVVGARWVYAEANNVSLESMEGLVVRHTCDNKRCVNPDHLLLGTQKENHHDAMDRGRHARGSRHGMSLLTEDQVREIRSVYVRGCGRYRRGNSNQLAIHYGVSPRAIRDVVSGHRWKHVV